MSRDWYEAWEGNGSSPEALAAAPEACRELAACYTSSTWPHFGLLAVDSSAVVRMAAIRRMPADDPRLDAFVSDPDPLVRAWLVTHVYDRPALLAQMTDDSDPRVRVELAQLLCWDYDFLRVLARDPDRTVRVMVARHAPVASEFYSCLLKDEDAEVGCILAKRYAAAKADAVALGEPVCQWWL